LGLFTYNPPTRKTWREGFQENAVPGQYPAPDYQPAVVLREDNENLISLFNSQFIASYNFVRYNITC